MREKKEIEQIKEKAVKDINNVKDLQELEKLRVAYLGKKGEITELSKAIGGFTPEDRPKAGQWINETKAAALSSFAAKTEELKKAETAKALAQQQVDISLPGKVVRQGGRHILSRLTKEIVDVFLPMGYSVAEGPEIELDYYNFTALNTPPGHPARSLQDTFYVDLPDQGKDGEVLLRTHTSPVQIRVMKAQKPPVYVICPGRTYRRDVPDPSHSPMFNQIEGLAVDEGITFGDLKGTLEKFAKAIFGQDRAIRLRPHFFPFTEPSAEVDVSCILCGGEGCRVCSYTGWLEILGAGMVDPNVLEEVGYDSEKYTGFAFGMGVERIAMLKHGVTDIRLFYENDIRFLKQL